jgi:signal transduction histidine kinase
MRHHQRSRCNEPARGRSTQSVSPRHQNQTGGVLVSVRDSGPGIATDNLDRIFDAFFSTKADGLGIGLSICRAIIQVHKGRLSARRPRAKA